MRFDKKNNELNFESVYEIIDWQKDLIPAKQESYDLAVSDLGEFSLGIWAQHAPYAIVFVASKSRRLTGNGLFPIYIQSYDEGIKTGYYLATKEEIYGSQV